MNADPFSYLTKYSITSESRVEWDEVCNFIPGISTVTNLVDIIQKLALFFKKESVIAEDSYYTLLDQKSFLDCALLMIPVIGNIWIGRQHSKSRALAAVRKDGWNLGYFHKKFQNDKEIVLAAVRKNGTALKYASENLRNDTEIVLAAVGQNGRALQYASENLRNDREIVLATVRQDGTALQYASENLQNDREFVLAAVRARGYALGYARKNFRNDREIVLAAVGQNGRALSDASENFRNDREIVLAAVGQNGWALSDASENLRNDRAIVLAAVRQDGHALRYASENLQNDRAIIAAANGHMQQVAAQQRNPNTTNTLDVHDGDRDERTKTALQLLRKHQGPLTPGQIEEGVVAFTQYLAKMVNENGTTQSHAKRAMRSLVETKGAKETFGPLLGNETFSIKGLIVSGQEAIARLWFFIEKHKEPLAKGNSIQEEADRINTRLGMITALSTSINSSNERICNPGKVQHLFLNVLQGRLKGANIDDVKDAVDIKVPTPQAVEMFFNNKTNQQIEDEDILLAAGAVFCEENPRVNQELFLMELKKYYAETFGE